MLEGLHLNSHKAQLVVSAVTASVATAAILYTVQAQTQRTRRRRLAQDVKESISSSSESAIPAPLVNPDFNSNPVFPVDSQLNDEEDTFTREQLARNYAFFGEESMQKIRDSHCVIIGCGGVGSWSAVMLARSGVAKLTLVDFDQVTLSSLNRHATATRADVGRPKVDCIAQTLKNISKNIQVTCIREIWRLEDGSGQYLHDADWVIDAIDNITTKIDLLKYCYQNNIKIFASMGAGAKCDPTRIQIADISNTTYDPLARSVRRRLRIDGIHHGIPCVYSTEVPDVKLLPLPEEEFQKGSVKELGAFDDFRVRILPVLGPLPAIFGLNIASYIICDVAGKPIPNPLPVKHRRKLYDKLYRDLLLRERKIAGSGDTLTKLPIDEDDVALIFEDLYRGRSVFPPHAIPTKPALVRWELDKPLTVGNCVVMEGAMADRHMDPTLRDASLYEQAQVLVTRAKKELGNRTAWLGW